MNIIKITIIFLCLLFSLTKSDTASAAYSCNINVYNSYNAACDEGTAYAQCQSARAVSLAVSPAWVVAPTCTKYSTSGNSGSWLCSGRNASNNLSYCDGAYAYYTYSGGQCSSRNTSYNGGVQDFKHIHNGTPQTCIAGCEIAHTGTVTIKSALGSTLSTTASSSYTGLACAAPLPSPSKQYTTAPTPTDDKEICTPLSDGQTSCLKADGQHCATSSKGNQYCWTPTETGEKVSADQTEVQRRNTGTKGSTTPLITAPPVGQTYSENNSHTVVTNTAYTVTNYSTTNNYNTGNATDGSTSGSSSGSTVTDSKGAEILAQLQSMTATVTGDIGDCSAAFTCVGNSGECGKVNGLRAQICATKEFNDVSSMDTSDGTEGFTSGGHNVGTVDGDLSSLDNSGFLGGSRSCPQFPVLDIMGKTIDFNNEDICDYFSIGASLVLLFAALASAKILSGGV